MRTDVAFVPYDQTFLEKSWEWLNKPLIKKLTDTPDFTKEDQKKWFDSLPDKADYFIRGVCFKSRPVGVVGLKKITQTDAEYWGYIGEINFWGRGIGGEMMAFAIETAKQRKLEKLYLTVLKENTRAIHLYQKFNFKIQNQQNDRLLCMQLRLEE